MVSPDAHPNGLAPLIERVRALGMEFGIWVEPEMVNPDSDLYRAHPEWALVDPGYEPVLARNQLVLDLTNADAHAEVLGRLDALLGDHDISFVKWDMNRDHVQATTSSGRAGTHAQTLALYALLDELRARHPGVEIESCASGGARIDLGILTRTERVWTSDCNDALERQVIQRHASMTRVSARRACDATAKRTLLAATPCPRPAPRRSRNSPRFVRPGGSAGATPAARRNLEVSRSTTHPQPEGARHVRSRPHRSRRHLSPSSPACHRRPSDRPLTAPRSHTHELDPQSTRLYRVV